MQLLAVKTPRILLRSSKCYDINEETYRQRFQSAKAKEGESPAEI